MSSKEEIREKHLLNNGLSVNKSPVGVQIQKAAYGAMDEYAKQEAIGFTCWMDGQSYECTLHTDEDEKIWQKHGEGKTFTTDELYYEYRKNKK